VAVLVTGGFGFVGLNVVEALLARDERVVVFDRQQPPFPTRDHPALAAEVVIGDIADARQVDAAFQRFDIRRVVHAAAVTAGTEREAAQPERLLQVNVQGTLNVLQAARHATCARVVYVSSGQAYGKTHDEGGRLYEEQSPSRPTDLYGISKFTAEQMALRLGELWHLDVVAARIGSVCGPWEFDTGVRDMLSPYLQVVRLALRGQCAVLPPGEVWRDWIYGVDVAEGLVALLQAGASKHRFYHLSSGMDWRGTFGTWCETLRTRYPGFSWHVARGDEPPNVSFVVERDRAAMDIGRIAEDVGFRPRFGPHQAYADYIEWISRHEAFIAGVPTSGTLGQAPASA
jgi:nucleoside-diphosphate-sugar epimerase